MSSFGILLKSYGPDLPYAERFMRSYSQYAHEEIPVFAVVPDDDVADFSTMMAGRGEVIPESAWAKHLVDYRIHGNAPGYINQEIIKLAFYELDLVDNYLCADSEAVFLRPFSSVDFMADSQTPFTFAFEDKELMVDPLYESAYGARRRQYLMALRQELGLPDTPMLTCHNMAVFSSTVTRSLAGYLQGREMSYANAMEMCPYEFSWYNFWLEKEQVIPRVLREPIFLMLHMEHQHLEYALKGVDEADLARGYVGVVVNSGFSRAHGTVDFEDSIPQALSRYVTLPEIARALVERGLRRAPRVRTLLRR